MRGWIGALVARAISLWREGNGSEPDLMERLRGLYRL